MLAQLRIGPIRTIKDVSKAFNDVENYINQFVNLFKPVFVTPAAGEFRVLVAQDDGTVQLYELVAGAGITITFDDTTHTCTMTSP